MCAVVPIKRPNTASAGVTEMHVCCCLEPGRCRRGHSHRPGQHMPESSRGCACLRVEANTNTGSSTIGSAGKAFKTSARHLPIADALLGFCGVPAQRQGERQSCGGEACLSTGTDCLVTSSSSSRMHTYMYACSPMQTKCMHTCTPLPCRTHTHTQ